MNAPAKNLPDPATRMSPQWIADALRMNPVTQLDDDNFRTCPVRLSWVDLFTTGKPMKRDDGTVAEGKYSTMILFPLGADTSLLEQKAIDLAYQKAPESYINGQFHGVHLPFRDQAEKCMKLQGFVPGAKFMTVGSKFQPQVLMPGPIGADGRVQWMPVTDPKKAYPGVWAICTINRYWFDVGKKKGVSYGLQNVCLISDDQQFGGGGGRDAQKDFGGVSVVANADFSRMMASAPVAPGAPGGPAPSVMPAPTPVYQQPAAPLPVPGLPPAPVAPAVNAEEAEMRALGLIP